MSGSSFPASESAGTFSAPERLPAGGNWTGWLSPYGNVDYYSLAARADRTITVKITALDESGKSTLRFRPRQDGGLEATWIAADGKSSMSAHLKPIDPQSLTQRERERASAPISPATAHGDGEEAEQ